MPPSKNSGNQCISMPDPESLNHNLLHAVPQYDQTLGEVGDAPPATFTEIVNGEEPPELQQTPIQQQQIETPVVINSHPLPPQPYSPPHADFYYAGINDEMNSVLAEANMGSESNTDELSKLHEWIITTYSRQDDYDSGCDWSQEVDEDYQPVNPQLIFSSQGSSNNGNTNNGSSSPFSSYPHDF